MSENKTEGSVQGFATKEEYGARLGNFQLGCIHIVRGRKLNGDISSPVFKQAKGLARELLDRLIASPFVADDKAHEIVDATPESKAEDTRLLELGFTATFGADDEREAALKTLDAWIEQQVTPPTPEGPPPGEAIPAAAGSVC